MALSEKEHVKLPTYNSTNDVTSQEVLIAKKHPSTLWRHHTIWIVLFINACAFNIMSTVNSLFIPVYISKKLFPNETDPSSSGSICAINKSASNQKHADIVQKEAANLNIYITLCVGVLSVITNVFLGTISDRFGRKVLFILVTLGVVIRSMLTAVIIYYEFNLYYLLPGFIVESLSGGFMASLQVTFSYIADITGSTRNRSIWIALAEIMISIGGVISGFGTGYVVDAIGFLWPTIIAISIFVLNLTIIIFLLPETLRDQKNSQHIPLRSYMKNAFVFYCESDSEDKRWKYILCIFIFGLASLYAFGRLAVDTLYLVSPPFCWNSVKIGWFSATKIFGSGVFGMGLVKMLYACLDDVGIAVFGTLSTIGGYLMQGFAAVDVTIFLAPAVGMGGVLTIPMIRSIMSRMTSVEQQGALFGGLAAVEQAAYVVGMILFSFVYSHTFSIYKGFAYMVLAGCAGISLCLLMLLLFIPKCSSSSRCIPVNSAFEKSIVAEKTSFKEV